MASAQIAVAPRFLGLAPARLSRTTPVPPEAKKKVTDDSNEIKENKKKVITEYRAGCRAYDEQQQVIRKLEWMVQAKTRLVKYKTQLDEDEAFKKQQEEERKDL